ncbi:hypothetical protein G9A89_000763 [Geosiphon pyriformis]|nr:hypothetical protein G9A89_000763 [Geosiphon pyriformis]
MIYMIPKEEKPISSCILESESIFDPNSNSDNDDNENTSSSSVQYDNENNNDSDSDLNSKTFIALPDLTKKQELKWFSNNDEDIMPEHAHDTNARFDLRSSLAKKGINIRGGIINAGYVRNIIAMLQNDSEKVYIIEPNEKIAQTIFLPLVKVAQLVSVGNREELGITARRISEFGFTNSGYWQVAMKPEDKEKMAFTTREENFEFEVMLFGLMNIPTIFQWLIEIVYTGLL